MPDITPLRAELSVEEQDILLWVAESETGLLEPVTIALADWPAFNTVVNRLVSRGLLDRDVIGSVEDVSVPYGLHVYLTDNGVQVVAELWLRRCLRENSGTSPLH